MKARALLIVLVIFVVALVAGVGYLGLNPPSPAPKPIEKTIPNEKFQVH